MRQVEYAYRKGVKLEILSDKIDSSNRLVAIRCLSSLPTERLSQLRKLFTWAEQNGGSRVPGHACVSIPGNVLIPKKYVLVGHGVPDLANFAIKGE